MKARAGLDAITEIASVRRFVAHGARALLALALTVVVVPPALEALTSIAPGSLPAGVVGVLVGLAAVAFIAGAPVVADLRRVRGLVARHESDREEREEHQRFVKDVTAAFDMSENEEQLEEGLALALEAASIGRSEMLVADESNAHLARFSNSAGRDAPGCDVHTPYACPAVRQGRTLLFGDVNGLAACPRLRSRELADDTIAACIPVSVLGAPTAVLHSVCEVSISTEERAAGIRKLEAVATRFGARLGMLRAIAQSKLQAEIDPLTGLLNRRAMENQVRELRMAGVPFTVAMADLDHFKRLNDTYGHDTGDRALRVFSRAVRMAIRDDDIVARYGGEEFAIVVPHTNVVTAAPVLHRIRTQLATELAGAEVPRFTVSIGMVDSSLGDDLVSLLRAADRALLEAKSQGRDRIVIGDGLQVGPPTMRSTDEAGQLTRPVN